MLLSRYLSRNDLVPLPTTATRDAKAVSKRVVAVLDVVSVLALQLLLYRVYFAFCQLPEAAYFSPFILVEVFKHAPAAILIFGTLVYTCLFYRGLTWRAIDPTSGARVFVVLIALTITWQFATYDYNLYYDQSHYPDRILLILLALLILWHPLFAPIFILFAIVIASQLHFPLPEASWLWPDKKVLFDAMILFNAFLYVARYRHLTSRTFLYCTLCLTGGVYFYAGVAKLVIGPTSYSWLMDNRLSNLIVSSYLQGWFGFLEASQVIRLANYLRLIDFPMALGTLVIELSALFILWSSKASRLILTLLLLLHIAIGLASGILFWKWCVFAFALIIFTYKTQSANEISIYGNKSFFLSVAVILLSFLYFRPVHFAWYDTRLSNFFTIAAVGRSGARYNLGPRFFSPYDITFSQSRFYYLLREQVLVGTYGTSQSHRLAQLLERAAPRELDRLRGQHGTSFYDEHLGSKFKQFLRRYVNNAQERGSKFLAINHFGPPYHFGRVSVSDRYLFQEPVDRLHVYYKELMFTGSEIREVKNTLIVEIFLMNDNAQ